MAVPTHIFRAYDIRGVFNRDLSVDLMARIGAAAASYAGENFIVGCDVRGSSPALKAALSAGIMSAGFNVYDIGVIPIGAAFFAVLELKKGDLAYVTASHLPPEWNGVKFCDSSGYYYEPDDIYMIRDLVISGNYRRAGWDAAGRVEDVEILESYVEFLEDLTRGGELKVVLDLGNGATALVAPRIYRDLGFKVFTLFDDIHPGFPGRGSEPTPEALGRLCREVKRREADLGMAFDGDGDRVVFVDDRGRPLLPEQAAIVLLESWGVKGPVVISVDASKILEDYVRSRGGKIIRIPVGHTFMVRTVTEKKALLGVEHSGHFAIGGFSRFDDGILASLKFCEAVVSLGKPISEVVPRAYAMKQAKVRVDDQIKFDVVNTVKDMLERKYGSVCAIDGVRIDGENFWVLVRASNTEPIVRVTVEAEKEEEAERILREYVELVTNIYEKVKFSSR